MTKGSGFESSEFASAFGPSKIGPKAMAFADAGPLRSREDF